MQLYNVLVVLLLGDKLLNSELHEKGLIGPHIQVANGRAKALELSCLAVHDDSQLDTLITEVVRNEEAKGYDEVTFASIVEVDGIKPDKPVVYIKPHVYAILAEGTEDVFPFAGVLKTFGLNAATDNEGCVTTVEYLKDTIVTKGKQTGLKLQFSQHDANYLWGNIPLPMMAEMLRNRGYWASNFPEGDGVCFALYTDGEIMDLTKEQEKKMIRDVAEIVEILRPSNPQLN